MKRIVLSLIILTHFVSVNGQNVPTYSWQEHLSFQNAKCIVEVENNIYCATENGLFYYNKDDYTINRLNKINGLSDVGISCLAYDKENKIVGTTTKIKDCGLSIATVDGVSLILRRASAGTGRGIRSSSSCPPTSMLSQFA